MEQGVVVVGTGSGARRVTRVREIRRSELPNEPWAGYSNRYALAQRTANQAMYRSPSVRGVVEWVNEVGEARLIHRRSAANGGGAAGSNVYHIE